MLLALNGISSMGIRQLPLSNVGATMPIVQKQFRFSKRYRQALEAALTAAGVEEKTGPIKAIERVVQRYKGVAARQEDLSILRLDQAYRIVEATSVLDHELGSRLHEETAHRLVTGVGRRLRRSKGVGKAQTLGTAAMGDLTLTLSMLLPSAFYVLDDAIGEMWRKDAAPDAALRKLAVEVAAVWKDATGQKMPLLPDGAVELVSLTTSLPHPLGVVLASVGLAVGPHATGSLQRFAEGGKLKGQLFTR